MNCTHARTHARTHTIRTNNKKAHLLVMFISKYESNDKKQFQQNKHVRVGGGGWSVGRSFGRSVRLCARENVSSRSPFYSRCSDTTAICLHWGS